MKELGGSKRAGESWKDRVAFESRSRRWVDGLRGKGEEGKGGSGELKKKGRKVGRRRKERAPSSPAYASDPWSR